MSFPGGSQSELRTYNEGRILDFVRQNPGSTQLEISRGVGLTRAAVQKLIGAERSSARQTALLRSVLTFTDDRPAEISLRGDLGCVMTLDLGAKHVRLRLSNLLGDQVLELDEPDRPIDVVSEPSTALDYAARLMEKALREGGYGRDDLAGVAVGVPFPVRRDGVVLAPGEWRYVQLPTGLWQRLEWRTPAVVRSDASLGAVAELEAALLDPGLRNVTRETTDLVYLKWSTQIAGAVITGGALNRGHGGLAGQFPHTPVTASPDAANCERCGRVCLNSVASLEAIVATLRADGLAADLEDHDAEVRAQTLVARAREGDQRCEQLLRDAAHHVGVALGTVINSLNPRLLIIGGAFQALDYGFLARHVHEGIEQSAFPPALDDVLIQSGRCTGSAAVQGGLAVALREFAVPHLIKISKSAGRNSRTSPRARTA